VLVFAAISVGVARELGASSAERNAAIDVVKDQARGDAAGVVRRIAGCRADASCAGRIRAQVSRLHTTAPLRVVRYDGLGGLSLGGRSGVARIVWKAGTRLPTVQCVRLRRSGDVVTGYRIHVLDLSAPIGREASCPGR
jgi:hypothetical protein